MKMARNNNFTKISLIFVFSLFLYVNGNTLCDDVEVEVIRKTQPVETKYGKVVGQLLTNRLISIPQAIRAREKVYSSFKGIRYAQPPIGKNRFLPPVEVEPWTQVYEAFEDGNICPQLDHLVSGNFIGNEDCLFLNVYTPVTNFDFNTNKNITNPKKAVMVWIHGGAFFFGTGNSDLYGPDFLVSKDVVLVAFNYRLGAPGFMNLNNDLIPGNAGMKDQTLALKWVKENIEKFGGDPDRITIFGQSAGGVSVDLHSISESSKNLFTRAISLSGSIFCSWAFTKRPFDNAKKLHDSISDACPYAYCDRGKMTTLFINEDIKLLTEKIATMIDLTKNELPFIPSIERISNNHTFIDECYLDKIKKGNTFHGQHMFGHTNLEANVVGRVAERLKYKWSILKKEAGILGSNIISSFIGSMKEKLKASFEQMLMKSDVVHESSYKFFEKPIDLKERFLQKFGNSNSTYFYLFEYEENGRDFMEGAAHSDDLRYLFYEKEHGQICNGNSLNKDVKLRNELTNLLTNFAKDGIPKSGALTWPDFQDHNKYLHINKHGHLQINTGRPSLDKCKRFDSRCNAELADANCEQTAYVPRVNFIMENIVFYLNSLFGNASVRPLVKFLFNLIGCFAHYAI